MRIESLKGQDVRVKNLVKDGDRWTWVVTTRSDYFDSQTVSCATNRAGDGLWVGNAQMLGTAQFTLSGCSKAAAYGRIRRAFTYKEAA